MAADVFVPDHRLVKVTDIYAGTAPGAGLHDSATYRWPMVPALALLSAMPALGSAERVTEIYAQRLAERMGWSLRLESQLGKGTRAILQFA